MLVREGAVAAAYVARLRNRATIAKETAGKMLAAADHGSDRVDRCRGSTRRNNTTHDGKCEHQPVQRIDANAPETHDPDRKARKIDAASDPQKFRMQVDPETFQDTPSNRHGNPKIGLAMAAQETTVEDPPTTREKQLDRSRNFVHTLEFPCPRGQGKIWLASQEACLWPKYSRRPYCIRR